MFQVQSQFHFIEFSHIFTGIAKLNEKQDNGDEVNENERGFVRSLLPSRPKGKLKETKRKIVRYFHLPEFVTVY